MRIQFNCGTVAELLPLHQCRGTCFPDRLPGTHEGGKHMEHFGGGLEDYPQRAMSMPPFISVRGSLLPDGGTGREMGMMVGLFVVGVVVALVLFYTVGVPR